jgi:hypothetical protein
MIKICINDDDDHDHDAVIYGRLIYLILLCTIPMDKRKDFFAVYGQLGTRPQEVPPSLV